MKIPKKESETVEFKLSFDKETIETITAFANTKGGKIYIGISDRGDKKGVTLRNGLTRSSLLHHETNKSLMFSRRQVL